MLSIIHDNLKIYFDWSEPKNSYSENNLIINGTIVTPYRISNKEKNNSSFFIVQLPDMYFTIRNNTLYGVHDLYGSFSGNLNEEILFEKIISDSNIHKCGL